MDLSALPTIVIKVNISCCESCPKKLSKLLGKTEGVESFDIHEEEDSVTIKGNVNPQVLVKNIAKALKKKKTKLLHYELPKEKDSDEETDGNHATQEREHSGTIEHPREPVMAYPPNDNYVERPRHVSSTNSACDYFSDENSSGCAIM